MFLQEWLTKNEMTAREFAAKLGKHESIVSRLLSGRQWPSYAIARQVMELTNSEVGFLDWPKPKKVGKKAA